MHAPIQAFKRIIRILTVKWRRNAQQNLANAKANAEPNAKYAKPNAKPNAEPNAKPHAEPNAKPNAEQMPNMPNQMSNKCQTKCKLKVKPPHNSLGTWSGQRRQHRCCCCYHIICGNTISSTAFTTLVESLMLCDAVCTAHNHLTSRAPPRHRPCNLQNFGISRNFLLLRTPGVVFFK